MVKKGKEPVMMVTKNSNSKNMVKSGKKWYTGAIFSKHTISILCSMNEAKSMAIRDKTNSPIWVVMIGVKNQ